MNAQEIFDTVAQHLIAQGKAAIDERGDCRYRAPDGGKCAVGCLIQEGEYLPDMEGLAVFELAKRQMLPPRLAVHERLLALLQDAHDERLTYSETQWRASMRGIASENGLDPSVLDSTNA